MESQFPADNLRVVNHLKKLADWKIDLNLSFLQNNYIEGKFSPLPSLLLSLFFLNGITYHTVTRDMLINRVVGG